MNAQAELNLRWAHMSEGTFSDVETYFTIYSRTSITRTSLGPCKFVLGRGSSIHRGLIIKPGPEAKGMSFRSSV